MQILGRAFMFAAGAVAGYCIVFYYADLLWVSGSTSGLIVTFIVAPAGALVSLALAGAAAAWWIAA